MRFNLLLTILLAAVLFCAIGTVTATAATTSEAPGIAWQQLLGGDQDEFGTHMSVQPAADGGYVLLGFTQSSGTGNVTGTTHGLDDVWVVKLNATGAVQWDRLLGGNGYDYARALERTADGGYILLATSDSSASGDVTDTTHGGRDLWVVKLDGTGAIQWDRLLGGDDAENAVSIQQTSDGGFIVLGDSWSSASGDVTGTNHGEVDLWVVKLDGAGAIQWQKLLGGSGYEDGWSSVQQTADGGFFLLAQTSSSESGDVTGTNHGYTDLWAVKLNGEGEIQWQRLLGGSDTEYAGAALSIADGGYLLLGSSRSPANGNVTGPFHGGMDLWVVKLDGAGEIQWQQLLGGSNKDTGYSVQRTADGGYVLLGDSWSSASGNVTGTNHGFADIWVVKLDAAGAVEWDRLLGGDMNEEGGSIQVAADGGYVLLGDSRSSKNGDVTGINRGGFGGYDLWVVKLGRVTPTVLPVPPSTDLPRDLNADQKYEDVNGNGRADFADVVLFFNQMTWIAENEPLEVFDYNGNGRIDFSDVVWLFNHL